MMQLKSIAFAQEGMIPKQYTCDGEGISPPLSWDAPPEGTQSLVLIVDDPDAPGQTFVHWVLYNLPPETRDLPERLPAIADLDNGGVQGSNDFDQLGYGGPCPPGGTHRYFFKLYALDTRLELPPGVSKPRVIDAMEGHILAAAELMGRYTRE